MAAAVAVIRLTGRTPRRITHQVTSPSTAEHRERRGEHLDATSRSHGLVDVVERQGQRRSRRREPLALGADPVVDVRVASLPTVNVSPVSQRAATSLGVDRRAAERRRR